MRPLVDSKRILEFVRALARNADQNTRLYLTGGATAVLEGWRDSTIDVDILILPESDKLMRAIPQLKESLKLNIELANPSHFIPEIPGWEDRSRYVQSEGKISLFHYDLYAQALAKIERGHEHDLKDVNEMFQRDLIQADKLLSYFNQIEPMLYKYPSINSKPFRAAVEKTVKTHRTK